MARRRSFTTRSGSKARRVSSARERRNRSNLYTLTGALLASFAIVLVVVILGIRPDPTTRAEIDWHDVHASAPNSAELVDPTFTTADGDWWANRAEFLDGADATWYVGLVSPRGEFVSLEQFDGSIAVDLTEMLDDAEPAPATISGLTGSVIDRSTREAPGNYERIYQFELPSGGTLIVSGTADPDEMELAAQRAIESLKG